MLRFLSDGYKESAGTKHCGAFVGGWSLRRQTGQMPVKLRRTEMKFMTYLVRIVVTRCRGKDYIELVLHIPDVALGSMKLSRSTALPGREDNIALENDKSLLGLHS